MLTPIFSKRDLAERYHRFLTEEVRQYLNARGIPDTIIDRELIGWNGRRITIPIMNMQGDVLTFRYARSPDDQSDSPKMLSEFMSGVHLYGWRSLRRTPYRVVICEGEFDRLVLEAQGFPAITSTGGAGFFLKEWARHFEKVRRVFICFDRDKAGEAGAENIKRLLPKAAIVRLPAEVGQKGDISDYFVRLGKSRSDFEALLATAAAKEEEREIEALPIIAPRKFFPKALRTRAERAKAAVRLADILLNFVDLKQQGKYLVARCPFHFERTASFTVYDDNTYYCFSCHAHGDVIEFLMQKEHMTFGQAIAALERFRYTGEIYPTSHAA